SWEGSSWPGSTRPSLGMETAPMSVRRLHPVQPESFSFTPENLAWAQAQLKNYPPNKQASAVIPILWRAQEQSGGWTTRAAIEYVAKLLDMHFIRVYEVATFYTMFHLAPVGSKAHVQVCGTTPCVLRGAEDLINVCKRRIHNEQHQLSADGGFSWEEVECLGACVNAPMVQIRKDTFEDLTPEIFERILDDIAQGREVKPGSQTGRQASAPQGKLTSLIDKSLYSGQRVFKRVEASPVPAAKAPEPEKAKEPAAATKAPPAPADAPPAKRAATETLHTPGSAIAGKPRPEEKDRARKAAARQKADKADGPAGRSTARTPPAKKDPG
ncbi:MAG: NADH-quinone oxidoreductase subunit NuoE, partial [Aestuariivirgaceae bacterium]